MNKLIVSALAACAISPAMAQTSVGISIGIHQPGVYGRINIGDLPAPALVLPQPVIIAQPQYRVERQPIYLYVPTPHQRDWRRYCGRYNACGQPVYFVRDQWVRERYQAEHPAGHRGHHRGWDKHADRGLDERGHRGDHDRGRGRGHERGTGGDGRQPDQPRHRHD